MRHRSPPLTILLSVVVLAACASDGPVVQVDDLALSRWVVDEQLIELPPLDSYLGADPANEVYQYRMGPGDVFDLSVWEDERLSGTYRVGPDGHITLPLFGSIDLSGLTRDEAAARISDVLDEDYTILHVSVIVTEFNNNNVFLLGAFEWPGEYKLEGRANLLQALSLARGFQPVADLSSLTVTRGSRAVYRINLDALLHRGDMSLNVALEPGDVVFLPKNDTRVVHVLGEVEHPGLVPVGRGLDLVRAVATAGSYTEDADLDEVRVLRRVDGQVRVFTVDLEALLDEGALTANIPLKPDDIVHVPRKGIATLNYVLRQISPSISTVLLADSLQDVGTD